MSYLTPYNSKLITTYADLLDHIFDFSENYQIIKTNVVENDENYVLNLIIPGFSKDEIEINVEKNTLNIQTAEAKKIAGINYEKINKKYDLPIDVDKENIVSSLENGILTITIPKLEKSIITKKIEIQ